DAYASPGEGSESFNENRICSLSVRVGETSARVSRDVRPWGRKRRGRTCMLVVSRFAAALLIVVSLAGCGSLSTFEGFFTSSLETTGSIPQARGKVYIFRGMGGRIASFEMDRLSEKLEKAG